MVERYILIVFYKNNKATELAKSKSIYNNFKIIINKGKNVLTSLC